MSSKSTFKGHMRNRNPGQWQVGEDHLDWEFEDVERAIQDLGEALPEAGSADNTLDLVLEAFGTIRESWDAVADWDLKELQTFVRTMIEEKDRIDDARSRLRLALDEFKGQAEGAIDRLIEYQEDAITEPPEAYLEIARLAADLVRYVDGDATAPDTERLRDLLRGLAGLKDHIDHLPVGYIAPCPPQEPVPFEWAPGTTPLLVTEGWRAGDRR